MIKCHLSKMLGERKLKVINVARDLDIHRGTLDRLYKETASRIDIDIIDKLCGYLGCTVGELFEYVGQKEG